MKKNKRENKKKRNILNIILSMTTCVNNASSSPYIYKRTKKEQPSFCCPLGEGILLWG